SLGRSLRPARGPGAADGTHGVRRTRWSFGRRVRHRRPDDGLSLDPQAALLERTRGKNEPPWRTSSARSPQGGSTLVEAVGIEPTSGNPRSRAATPIARDLSLVR